MDGALLITREPPIELFFSFSFISFDGKSLSLYLAKEVPGKGEKKNFYLFETTMIFYWEEIWEKEAVAKLNTILRRGLQYSALIFPGRIVSPAISTDSAQGT